MNLFEYTEQAIAMRNINLDIVESNNLEWVEKARRVGLQIARTFGRVSIEDVLKICPRPDSVSQNAVGSVLRGNNLRLVGYKVALKKSSHGRKIGIYELIND